MVVYEYITIVHRPTDNRIYYDTKIALFFEEIIIEIISIFSNQSIQIIVIHHPSRQTDRHTDSIAFPSSVPSKFGAIIHRSSVVVIRHSTSRVRGSGGLYSL